VVVGHRGEFTFPAKRPKSVTAGEALGELVFFLSTGVQISYAEHGRVCCEVRKGFKVHQPTRSSP